MESALTWEYEILINELTQGIEKAKQLQFHLRSSEEQNLLLQRVISSFEHALLILKWTGSKEQHQAAGAAPVALECSVSVDGSSPSEDMNRNYSGNQDHANNSKKRKLQPTWTEQVKVNAENGLEGPTDDGYSWRKYGQKDILAAKYPRSYYRCTYRLVQNCWATKQVQRSDEDPKVFDITYKGTHTCNHSTNAVPPPASPKKQEAKQNGSHYYSPQQSQTLTNFKTNLRVDTENFDNEDLATQFSFPSAFTTYDEENCYHPISALDGNYQSYYAPLFLSPATSESNYFSAATYPMKSNWGGEAFNLQHSEADIAEIISTHASASNSPIGGMEFSIDYESLYTSFPFQTTDFFTHSNFEC